MYGVSLVCYLLLLHCSFNILSLCLVFVSLINKCLGVFLLGLILYGTFCASWTWLTISLSMLGTFSTIISSKVFSNPFFFSSSSGTPIIWMLVCLILSQRSLWKGNGNPLQCSCLENPRDGGAWWAAVYGVAQSWTWLNWLSSSSSRGLWDYPVFKILFTLFCSSAVISTIWFSSSLICFRYFAIESI